MSFALTDGTEGHHIVCAHPKGDQTATVWYVLRRLDCWTPIQGFGRLLQSQQ
jgi:hypothetical protein